VIEHLRSGDERHAAFVDDDRGYRDSLDHHPDGCASSRSDAKIGSLRQSALIRRFPTALRYPALRALAQEVTRDVTV
jgi:hypothetical protein